MKTCKNAKPEIKERHRKRAAAYRKVNAEKIAARNAVNNAVRDGKLFFPASCEVCKAETKLEGHHDDYSKPLDVRWLCRRCHKAHHAPRRYAPRSGAR